MLSKIRGPEDLKKISRAGRRELVDAIRKRLIEVISKQGGHLGASLGAVEIAVAVHYVFNSPQDRIIWDVGHQAYAHKILTGRNDALDSIRTSNGLSGFPKRSESVHDVFGTGHASTSISAALGMCVGARLKKNGGKVIAVIGDGSMTGGLAYEGLNNIPSNSEAARSLIIILNDNGMSISPNVGGLAAYLSRKFSGSLYRRIREELKASLNDRTVRLLKKIKKRLKNFILPGQFFESLGLRYVGPVDGHNLEELIEVLKNLVGNDQDIPVLLHVNTQKGKGFSHAESSPVTYHGVPGFNSETGVITETGGAMSNFTDVFSETLLELAERNPDIVAITAAMTTGTGLTGFAAKFPERFFDVGIAEEHAVTFAAGMACEGMIPVVAIYSTFLQRSFDQIIHDVCLQNLPVVFCLDRAGLVGEDGPTHHGNFDLSYLRVIPNLIVMAPRNASELRDMLYSAVRYRCPVAIRYPRARVSKERMNSGFRYIPPGSLRQIFKAEIPVSKLRVLLVSWGPLAEEAMRVAGFLAVEGISVEVIDARFVKPVPGELFDAVKRADLVFTLEENALAAGAGSALMERLSEVDGLLAAKINLIGIKDVFVEHGKRTYLLGKCGLDRNSILKTIMVQIIRVLSDRRSISKDTETRFLSLSQRPNLLVADGFGSYEKRAN